METHTHVTKCWFKRFKLKIIAVKITTPECDLIITSIWNGFIHVNSLKSVIKKVFTALLIDEFSLVTLVLTLYVIINEEFTCTVYRSTVCIKYQLWWVDIMKENHGTTLQTTVDGWLCRIMVGELLLAIQAIIFNCVTIFNIANPNYSAVILYTMY